jgi:hypothetical protein
MRLEDSTHCDPQGTEMLGQHFGERESKLLQYCLIPPVRSEMGLPD